MVYYGNQTQLEYDFVVAPRADPSKIVLALDGADWLELDPRGHLLAHVAGGRIELKKPVAYQDVDGVRTDVPIRYAIREIIGFISESPRTTAAGRWSSTRCCRTRHIWAAAVMTSREGIAADSQGSAHAHGDRRCRPTSRRRLAR